MLKRLYLHLTLWPQILSTVPTPRHVVYTSPRIASGAVIQSIHHKRYRTDSAKASHTRLPLYALIGTTISLAFATSQAEAEMNHALRYMPIDCASVEYWHQRADYALGRAADFRHNYDSEKAYDPEHSYNNEVGKGILIELQWLLNNSPWRTCLCVDPIEGGYCRYLEKVPPLEGYCDRIENAMTRLRNLMGFAHPIDMDTAVGEYVKGAGVAVGFSGALMGISYFIPGLNVVTLGLTGCALAYQGIKKVDRWDQEARNPSLKNERLLGELYMQAVHPDQYGKSQARSWGSFTVAAVLAVDSFTGFLTGPPAELAEISKFCQALENTQSSAVTNAATSAATQAVTSSTTAATNGVTGGGSTPFPMWADAGTPSIAPKVPQVVMEMVAEQPAAVAAWAIPEVNFPPPTADTVAQATTPGNVGGIGAGISAVSTLDATREATQAANASQQAAQKATLAESELASTTTKSPYEIAKAGGKHAKTFRDYSQKPLKQINKAIRSYDKKIEQHTNLIKDPRKYLTEYGKPNNWDSFDPGRKARELNHWAKELKTFKELKNIMEGIRDAKTA